MRHGRALRWLVIALALAAGMAGVTTCVRQSARWAASVTGVRSWEAYHESFGPLWTGHRDVAAYLREHTDPADPVHVWGLDAVIYFLADRDSPTRFGFCYPLYAAVEHAPAFADEWVPQLRADLYRNPPAYIVMMEDDRTDLMPVPPSEFFLSLPGFPEILSAYEKETVIRGFELWRRTAPLPDASATIAPPEHTPRAPAHSR